MRSLLYLRLAVFNIRTHYRFYIPRMLTGTGLLAVLYIVYTLACDERTDGLAGEATVKLFMGIACAVMILLTLILLFYTGNFLMRRRKKEYGLYSVLGMEKRHAVRVCFFESLISDTVSCLCGLLLGILFYRACQLLLCLLMKTETAPGLFYIRAETLLFPLLIFAGLNLAVFLVNAVSICRMKPVQLLSAAHTGEKEPKTRTVMFAAGLVCLLSGYGISLLTKQLYLATTLFPAAVILVIAGTFFLFTAGSIFVLKKLKANDRFYLNGRRMPAVAGLLFRMKQNAVGLAGVCILSTGVLVMVSTTVSLYSGMQKTLDVNYPREYYVSLDYIGKDGTPLVLPAGTVADALREAAAESGNEAADIREEVFFSAAYRLRSGVLETQQNAGENLYALSDISSFIFVPEDKCYVPGGIPDLEEDEIAVFCLSGQRFPYTLLTVHGIPFRVRIAEGAFPIAFGTEISVFDGYGIVVKNEEVFEKLYTLQEEAYGKNASRCNHRLSADFADREALYRMGSQISEGTETAVQALIAENGANVTSWSGADSVWEAREAVLSLYGPLLFIGIMLGMVCLFAAVLVIYFKQISEGLEDRERFRIMRRVGMTEREAKQTVRTQTRMVFFLPLVGALIHLVFAFPILNRLLHLLLLPDTKTFVLCALVTSLVFALVYALVYRLTARAYTGIALREDTERD